MRKKGQYLSFDALMGFVIFIIIVLTLLSFLKFSIYSKQTQEEEISGDAIALSNMFLSPPQAIGGSDNLIDVDGRIIIPSPPSPAFSANIKDKLIKIYPPSLSGGGYNLQSNITCYASSGKISGGACYSSCSGRVVAHVVRLSSGYYGSTIVPCRVDFYIRLAKP